MTVYVDDYRAPLGRMRMCHMIADSHEELVKMALLIGVARRHIQYEGLPNEHFDICLACREAAIKAGAQLVTTRQLVMLVRAKRERRYLEVAKRHGDTVRMAED